MKRLLATIAAAAGVASGAFASTIDLSGLTGDKVLRDGDVVTGMLNATGHLSFPKLTIADDATVTLRNAGHDRYAFAVLPDVCGGAQLRPRRALFAGT